MANPFSRGKWIWHTETPSNAYVLFVKTISLSDASAPVHIRITASYHYELYLNGTFVARGPVHGDPHWCQYDELDHVPQGDAPRLHVAILVHHASGTHLHYLLPAPGGLIAEFQVGDQRFGTDASWKCLALEMWQQDVPARGWALDYCEEYDATLEPAGWQEKIFPPQVTDPWEHAVLVEDASAIWAGYQERITPYLERRFVSPARFKAFRAPGAGAQDVGDISSYCDKEDLAPVCEMAPFDLAAANERLREANALTFDLGREHIGFYALEIEAPAGVVIELSGAELLRDGRPWIYRKGTRYSVRYRTRAGRQRFVSFSWNGYRYLHLVARGSTEGIRIHHIGCLERKAPLTYTRTFRTDDEELQRIYDLCRYTLEVGAQEHLIDCPTREQTQYFGDALFIAQSLWVGFEERSYLEWYLQCFLHVPFKENGQISCTYPGEHIALLDYSLIPLLGQRFYVERTGSYYEPQAAFGKTMRLKRWYDTRLDARGLVSFDYEAYAKKGLRNFIDHPGIGWHHFSHPGIDRDGVSCPLNLFFYAFVRVLSQIADDLSRSEASALSTQARTLRETTRQTFYDGRVFHDAEEGGVLSEGTSWQTNALAVCFDIVQGKEATRAMSDMLAGYDRLCRCSPYFHFYFLRALRKAGLERDAIALIKREWRPMLERDATTTWEGFLGDELDSLCHPWSTAPFLFLLERESSESVACSHEHSANGERNELRPTRGHSLVSR
jgi:alpha-L-rhamnosidase